MYRKEKRTIFFWAKRKYREIRDFLFSLFGQEAGRVLIETLSRPGNESCSMAPTPRPGLETNDIAFPTPGNQMEILCVLSKTDELSNNETTLLWTILSSSGPMQLEKQIWSDWWAIRKVLLHWREEEDNYKSYFSEVQKEIMTKLAIVRSIKMIKLMNLTRTIHALKTKKENNQNYYFVLH